MEQVDFGRQQIRRLIAQTGLPVVTVDPQGAIVYVSPALERLLQVTFGDFRDREIGDVLDLRAGDGVTPLSPDHYPLTRARRGEPVQNALLTVLTPDERLIYLRVSAAPLIADDGTITGAVSLLQDVTTEMSIRREQDELRSRLIETINHEFRTPLTKLFGHAELLQDLGGLSPMVRRSVGAMLAAAGDLRDFLHTLSGLVDLERHARLNVAYGDLAAALRTLVDSQSAEAARHGQTLTTHLPEELHVTVDHVETIRAVRELLANAIQHSPAGSEIVLRLVGGDPLVEVEVADAGPGIPESDRARLVEPFERGGGPDASVSSRGLGLAIANTVATAHGGRLTLEGNEPSGLRATLAIPRARGAGS